MSPRRLLVVIDEMEVGGSQRQIVRLLLGLDRTCWQPELAYFRGDSFLVAEVAGAGIPVHHLPKRGRLDPRFLAAFTRLLWRGHYDLVHAFSLTAELWSIIARAPVPGQLMVVASERNQQVGQPAWYWWLKRFVLTRSVAAIANSDAGARTTARHTGMPPDFFDTVHNGVPVPAPLSAPERETVRAGIGVPAGRVLALFVGRLVPQKNLECLLAAMEMLEPGCRPWLAVVGDGPLRTMLEHRAGKARAAGDVCFLGERDDATRLMQAADFLVLPSHFEGMPNVLLESMAAGCPVIASNVDGNRELVEHECTGLLFDPGEPEALAMCLQRLTGDTQWRSQLALRARDHVEQHFGIPALVESTTAVYDRCLRNSRGRSSQRQPTARQGDESGSASARLPTWSDAND